MGKLSKLTPIISIFCIFFFIYHIIITVSSSTPPRYIAVEDITLDCGSGTSGKSKGMDGRYWSGDFQSKFFPKEEHNLKSVTSQTQAPEEGHLTKAPYATARISHSQFTYVFPLTVGPKFVRLHFYSTSYSGFEEFGDNFTIKAGSFTLLRHFSASNYGYTTQEKIVKEFCIYVDEMNEKLNITFVPFSNNTTTSSYFYAFINGIEIVSMPNDLYYSPEGQTQSEKIPSYVGERLQFYINYNMALQMVFRLNVGGSLISPVEDTGFFRKWSADIKYLGDSVGVVLRNLSLMPKENYAAPDDVYRSARTGSYLRWELPVDLGFNYLVRLHFCEIDHKINLISQRRFTISIDNKLAEDDADVIRWTGSRDTPIYKDYVVLPQKKEVEDDNQILFIVIYTNSPPDTAILNGVEIFKLINPEGSERNLAEPSPVMVPITNKTIFLAIGSVGLLVVLISVSFMVQLKKFTCWRDPYKGKSTWAKALSLPEELCRHFSLDEIRSATNNFHKELIIGQGGFGNAYKVLRVVEPVLESDSCIELTTSNSELTNPSLDSDGITSTV